MAALHWRNLFVLNTLFQRYKSNRQKYSSFYEKELFKNRHKPLNLLQVGVESSIPVWNKFLDRSNIYCIDKFDKREPNKYYYLNEKRIYWSRCNIDDQKSINDIMKNVWNKPRFDIIIDNVNNFALTRYEYLRRYCIGKYYVEDGNDIRIMK